MFLHSLRVSHFGRIGGRESGAYLRMKYRGERAFPLEQVFGVWALDPEAFEAALREAGWVLGRELSVDPMTRERRESLAAELDRVRGELLRMQVIREGR